MLAPTPHYSQEMMDQFAKDLLSTWLDLGLPLTAGAGLAAAAWVNCVVTVPERRHYDVLTSNL